MNLEDFTVSESITAVTNIFNRIITEQKLGAFGVRTRVDSSELAFMTQIEEHVQEVVIEKIRERQKKIKGLIVEGGGYKAYWGGDLTPGCHICLEKGGFIAFRSVNECNLDCSFCYHFEKKAGPKVASKHYIIGKHAFTLNEISILLDKQGGNLPGVAWVWYEPFLDFDKHPPAIKLLSKNCIHQHLYTNGTLCTEDHFKLLSDSGLTEIRFNLAATNCSRKVLKTMATGRKYFKYLGIESPMTLTFFNSFMENKKAILDTGVDHINCAELHLGEKNAKNYCNEILYSFKQGYISPISSRHLTYDLLEIAYKEKWQGVVINDCSNENKFYRGIQRGDRFGEVGYAQETTFYKLAPVIGNWYVDALKRYDYSNVCKE